MSRKRIEDLGRLTVILDKLSGDETFDLITCRSKDFVEAFRNYTKEKQDDLLHNIAYGLSSLKDSIIECYMIAAGKDELNEDK